VKYLLDSKLDFNDIVNVFFDLHGVSKNKLGKILFIHNIKEYYFQKLRIKSFFKHF